MKIPFHRYAAIGSFCTLMLYSRGELKAQSTLPASQSFTLVGAEIIDQDNNTTFSSNSLFGFGTVSIDAPTLPANSGDFSLSGSLVGGANPSVVNTVTETVLSDPGSQSGQSSTSFQYNFEVVGPTTTSVAVDISAVLSDSWSSNLPPGGLFDSAQLGIYDPDLNQLENWTISDSGDPSGGESLGINQSMALSTNTLYTVYLGTNAGIQLVNAGVPIANDTYSTSVSIDPSLSIDPSFQLAGYTLELSSDLQSSSVPDAANTAMILFFSTAFIAVIVRRKTPLAKV